MMACEAGLRAALECAARGAVVKTRHHVWM